MIKRHSTSLGYSQKIDFDDHNYLRQEVPKTALKTSFKGGTVQGLLSRPWRLPLLVSEPEKN